MKPAHRPVAPPLAMLGGTKLSPVPLHIVRPRFPALEEVAQSFEAALRSGIVTNHGPHVRQFEEALTRFTGAPTLAFSNGQSAIMVMLRAAGISSGEVIVPALTFSATPHAVRWVGAEPVFADSRSDDLTLDPDDVERHITERTVAILAVDVFGIPCDYQALDRLARERGLRMLYDSAPSFGAVYRDTPIGRFGDAQAFSFHATKAFPTMEGGGLSSRDAGLIERAGSLRNFGQSSGADCDEPGINGKMMEICALLGLKLLPGLNAAIAHRGRVADRYRRALAQIPGLALPQVAHDVVPAWLYYPVRIDAAAFGLGRDAVAEVLACENLHVRKYYEMPCHHMKSYSAQRQSRLPVAEQWGYNTISLPIYNDMSLEEADLFVEGLRRIHAQADRLRTLKGW